MKQVTVIGAGLAGCEAAWQLATHGIEVELVEMKPLHRSDAHQSDSFAELVCSNSLRSDRPQNAVGLLKEEMRALGSLILQCADATRVPAGGALAVDREGFSRLVTERIAQHPNIRVRHAQLTQIPTAGHVIVASGPMTDGGLAQAIAKVCPQGTDMHFYDAVAPIVEIDSVDMTQAFRSSRYDRGSDYLNCPLTREEYEVFHRELCAAQVAPLHAGEQDVTVFEGCVPVETLAKRGHDTLLYGPLKPVGLTDPRTGRWPFAAVQLRQDDAEGRFFNLVGFQTRLTYPEQKRVFGLIPALRNARFLRYGVMHRSTYLDAPGMLDCHYRLLTAPRIAFAGQITGVEGYVESAASGFVAGWNMARALLELPLTDFTDRTALGALGYYAQRGMGSQYQPMNVTFGIIALPTEIRGGKKNRVEAYIRQSRAEIARIMQTKWEEQTNEI